MLEATRDSFDEAMGSCYDWLHNVPGVSTVVQFEQRQDWVQDVATFYTTILPGPYISQFREGLKTNKVCANVRHRHFISKRFLIKYGSIFLVFIRIIVMSI